MKTVHIFLILATYPLFGIIPAGCAILKKKTVAAAIINNQEGTSKISEKKMKEIFPNVLDEQPAIYKVGTAEKNNKKFSF